MISRYAKGMTTGDIVNHLQAAGFDLFDEQGFDSTTVAEIARRAGLTQRSFFNHFANKREVLFSLSSEFQDRIVAGIAMCDASVRPLAAVVLALQSAGEAVFEGERDTVARRQMIVDANPELRERELGKQAVLTGAIATALQERGLEPDAAFLVAGAALLVQGTAVRAWVKPGESRPLRDLLAEGPGTAAGDRGPLIMGPSRTAPNREPRASLICRR